MQKGEAVKKLVRDGRASHVQTVGKGGLAITLARMSAFYDLGMDVSLSLTNAQLFSETQGRYVVAVKDDQPVNIERAIAIGSFTDNNNFVVSNGDSVLEDKVSNLKEVWEGAIAQCMTTKD